MKKNTRSDETKDWVYIINYYLPELQYKCTNKKGPLVPVTAGGWNAIPNSSNTIYTQKVTQSSTGIHIGPAWTTVSGNIQNITHTPPKNQLSNVPGKVSIFIHFKDPKYPKLKFPYFAQGFGLNNIFQDCLYKFLLSIELYKPIQEVLFNSVINKNNKDKIVNQITKSCTW